MKRKHAALLLGTALLFTFGETGLQAQDDSPMARGTDQRAGYPRDVIVAQRWSRPADGTPNLGVAMIPGLQAGEGSTMRVFDAPASRVAGGAAVGAMNTKLITLRPVNFRGVPLAPGSDILSIANSQGRVLLTRERNLPRAVDGTQPTVQPDAAARAALLAGGVHGMPADATAGVPTLEVFVDGSLQGHLAWRIRVASASLTDPWARELWIAAIGEPVVLADREAIYHTHHGHATATAWSDTPFGPSPAQDLAGATVTRNGNAGDTTTTGANGSYAFASGAGNATLEVGVSGPFSVVNNVAGNEVAVSAIGSPSAPVDLFLNAAGDEELAQTSAFVWVNRAHAFTEAFLPAGALANVPTNVNLNSQCNAFWNGSSLNFFHAAGGCPNTAYSDVVMHEYGHAVDQSLGGILDGGYSEGFGDALAILRTRQSCAGRDFFGPGTCLRQANDVVLWPPDTDEVHAVGRRYAGFVQALINELTGLFTETDAFEIARQIVLGSAAANPGNIPDAVELAFVVDDDDGDLSNGTPHCAELSAAAESRHIPHPTCPTADHVRTTADINGDRRADIIGFGDAGVWTALSTGDGGFAPERFVLANFGASQGWDPARHVRLMADINGDGKADIVAFGDAGVWTALASGDGGFLPEKFVLANFGTQQAWSASKHIRLMADIDGDGRADIVAFGDAGVWTALSTGDGGFGPATFVLADFGVNQGWSPLTHVRTLADINGDGRADIVAFGNAGVFTALSAGNGGFATRQFVLADLGTNQGWTAARHVRTMADINGDGRADIVAFGDAGVWTALALGNGGFAPNKFVLADLGFNQGWNPARHVRTMTDLNGDGRLDIVAFGDAGVWTALSTGSGGFTPNHFVLADFGGNQGWSSLHHVRRAADISADSRGDIVGFGDAGVWTALSTGDGAFAPHRFVLANFGTNQGWKGGKD